MRYFDLHCDTMTECCASGQNLHHNNLHIDLERAQGLEEYMQCYAAWIPDNLHGEAAYERFCAISARLDQETAQNSKAMRRCRRSGDISKAVSEKKHGAILTVENGSALGGRLEHVEDLKRLGVKMCTLTWNGENELGRGVLAPGSSGLSPFGRKALTEFEKADIVVDLSHSSPELFYDVASLAKKPFVASHSNAKKVCSHVRNLTDPQFEAIKASGGLVGLNFYKGFLNDDPERASMEDILRHAEHFLSLGGENVVSIGGDFDGASLPADMGRGLGDIPKLFEMFLRHNYPESLVHKIFYENAAAFFKRQDLL